MDQNDPHFMLDPYRRIPSRERRKNGIVTRTGGSKWLNGDAGGQQIGTTISDCESGVSSVIYDEPAGYKQRDVWHSVLHEVLTVEPHEVQPYSAFQLCKHPYYRQPLEGYSTMPGMNCTQDDLSTAEHILETSQFQDALEGVLMEYYRKLYSFRPEQLPDMSVFMAELGETMGVANLLYGYAKELRGYISRIDSAKSAIKLLDIDISKSLKKKQLVKAQELKLKALSLKKVVNDMSDLVLSWRFGVLAPMRDFIKIVASTYEYWEHLMMEPQMEHIRRNFYIDEFTNDVFGSSGCWYGQNGQCNYITGERPGTTFKKIERSIEGSLTITVNYNNRLKGSNTEKIVYSILSQLGLMPDVMSIWEITKLSWFLDYFVRLQSYFIRMAVGLDLGMQSPIVLRQSISLKYTEKVTSKISVANCPWVRWHNDQGTITLKHYERIAEMDAMSLLELTKIVRLPSVNQGVNATALVLQILTGKYPWA